MQRAIMPGEPQGEFCGSPAALVSVGVRGLRLRSKQMGQMVSVHFSAAVPGRRRFGLDDGTPAATRARWARIPRTEPAPHPPSRAERRRGPRRLPRSPGPDDGAPPLLVVRLWFPLSLLLHFPLLS